VVLSVGGVVSYAVLTAPPAGREWAAPAYLAVAGVLALALTRRSEWPALLGAAAMGWLAEAVGVASGVPFGAYRYTAALGPAIAGVPVVMGAAWMVLLAWVRQWRLPIWAGALTLTALDLVIDPLAAGPLGFWEWAHRGPYYGIPLSNFAGWLVISAVLMVWSQRWPAHPNAATRWLGRSVLGFFTLLAILRGMAAPAGVGLVLLAAEALRSRSAARQSPGNNPPASPVSPRPPSDAESVPRDPPAAHSPGRV